MIRWARGSPRGDPASHSPKRGSLTPPPTSRNSPRYSGYAQTLPTMRSPSAIAGKTLPRTPSTRNLVVGVGAVEGVSYGDGVARVGLTRGVVYHQKVKANLNRLQTKKNKKKIGYHFCKLCQQNITS
jgi:hypothetical protein